MTLQGGKCDVGSEEKVTLAGREKVTLARREK